jgi:hypothetical protein
MSGGPYLADDGVVVGIHRGGARYTAGYAHMVPIWWVRQRLEQYLPPIPSALPPNTMPGPRTGVGVILFDGFQRYGDSAFNFQSGRVVSWGDPTWDLGVSNSKSGTPREPQASFFVPHDAPPYSERQGAQGGITEAPVQNLANADDCRLTTNYTFHWFKPQRDKIYCVRTRNGGSYAKVSVRGIEPDKISFDWIYQPALQN